MESSQMLASYYTLRKVDKCDKVIRMFVKQTIRMDVPS